MGSILGGSNLMHVGFGIFLGGISHWMMCMKFGLVC